LAPITEPTSSQFTNSTVQQFNVRKANNHITAFRTDLISIYRFNSSTVQRSHSE